MKELEKKVADLAKAESERAITRNGMFRSAHEGYAVLLEEVEECNEAIQKATKAMMSIWDCTRKDVDPVSDGFLDMLETLAVSIACEAIQVAAMCQKYVAASDKGWGD